MYGFEYGYKRATSEIIGGIITGVVVRALIEISKFSPEIISSIMVLNFVSTLLLIFTMPYWGTSYMIGWIFGILILSSTKLLNSWELFLYLGSGMLVLFIRLKNSNSY